MSDDELRRAARQFGPQVVRRAGEAGDCPHGELRHTCYVCDVEAERDRLRAAVDELTELTTRDLHLLIRLDVALGPDRPADRRDMPNMVAEIIAERDRLRAVVARYKAFAESEILDRVAARLGVDLRRQLEEGT